MMSIENYYAFFSVAALIYLVLLTVVYSLKKKVKKLENTLFYYLVIITIVSIGVEIFADFAIARIDMPTIFVKIIEKGYLLTNIIWTYVICLYAFIISLKENEALFKFKRYASILAVLLIPCLTVICFLDIGHYVDTQTRLMIYLEGKAVTMAYGVSLFYMFLAVVFNLKYFVKIHKQNMKGRFVKRLIIYVTFAWAFILLFIQIYVPQITLLSFSQVIIVTIIYFFLENPDLDLVDEITIARTNAEIANNAKTNFLSSMSHEIRTPLNAIVGLSETIAANPNISDTVKEDIEDITAASQSLLEIIGNIIDINKIETDKLEIVNVKYHLEEEIEPLIRVVSTRIGGKPIELNINMDKNIPYELIGDKFHVKSILNNLLTNAIKYTEQGKIDVNIGVSNVVPNESCLLHFSVKDTGVGIKPENLQKLFSKFERLDFEGSTQVEGTGLGLSITKKIIDYMGGTIDVNSVYGIGSSFDVTLPQRISKMECELTNTQVIDVEAINERIKSDLYSGKRVLIVDDNKLNLKVAKKAVESFNFEIDECVNGEECINKIIAGNKYDVILMDIMMPVMDGETAMKELKKLPGFNTPVVAVTADAIAGAKEKYLSAGFTEYIAKPFTKEQIKIKLDSIFRHNS